jgi:hypothetical protein
LGFADNFAEEKAKTTFHRILVEQVLPTFMEKDDALLLLEEHITNNILKVSHPPPSADCRWASNSTGKKSGYLKVQWCQLFCAIYFMPTWKRKSCRS